jgi:multiple sugar transport system ATP-binding protein
VAQIGPPMALYHRPASVFVAEFIGSPKMNMLGATFVRGDDRHAVIDLNGQQVTVAVDARHLSAGAPVRLGLRPEDLPVGDEGAGTGIRVMVRHVERLGDVSLLYVDYGTAPTVLTVRVEGSVKPAAGHGLTLRLLPERLHLFDAAGKACPRSVELPV